MASLAETLQNNGFAIPPLLPPLSCSGCQRPLQEDKRRFGTCFQCGQVHAKPALVVRSATYVASGSDPYRLVVDVKDGHGVFEHGLLAMAVLLWQAIYAAAPAAFDTGSTTLAVPVPSSKRLVMRALEMGQARGWPAIQISEALRADPERPRQVGLTQDQRREAAAGKHDANVRLDGVPVLLLDDVYTSGYTMQDAARAVRDAGAASVRAAAIARRVFPDDLALYRALIA